MPLMSLNDESAPLRRVRTRFAPSPTGMLHIGGFRTVLFSYLLARHFGGDFVLRIEDTDQNRLVPGALRNIIESLRGMGIIYDEGPDAPSVALLPPAYGEVPLDIVPEYGGDFGPYFQSQRLTRYRDVIDTLLREGKAYYAFDTKEELEASRAEADAAKVPYRYDRKYRDYPLADAEARIAAGEASTIRFKMPIDGTIRTTDALRGDTDWDAKTQDDFVIMKGDGFPPYHLAATVDDHDMQISHVLRGEEWISSFPKHVCIYAALGWELPIFAHTPSVLGPDGTKLSKRHGAKGVGEFLAEGYLQETLVNFLALTGWSPGDDLEILTLDEIIEKFDISGISVSPAILDVEKMKWMNGKYIRSLSPAEYVKRALPYLVEAGLLSASPTPDELAYAERALVLEQEKVKLLNEVVGLSDFFFSPLPTYQEKSVEKWLRRDSSGTAAYLTDVAAALSDLTAWELAAIDSAVWSVGASHSRAKGEVTHPIRVAVTGREVGPGLFEVIETLGRDRTLARLKHAVELARG